MVRNYPICEVNHKTEFGFYCYKTGTECVESEKSVTQSNPLLSRGLMINNTKYCTLDDLLFQVFYSFLFKSLSYALKLEKRR